MVKLVTHVGGFWMLAHLGRLGAGRRVLIGQVRAFSGPAKRRVYKVGLKGVESFGLRPKKKGTQPQRLRPLKTVLAVLLCYLAAVSMDAFS